MKTNIVLRGFTGLEHHYSFVQEEANSSIAKFERAKEFRLNILLKRSTSKHGYSSEMYECEVLLLGDNLRGKLFFKKSSNDFYSAVRHTFRAAEKSLRRESKTRVSRRRKLNRQTLPQLIEDEMVA